jgi:phage tail sheath protein FI
MPVQPTYPGVYIEELPSGVHTITGVATSITAFIGRALRGPVNKAMTIESYADFERIHGGLWLESALGYAVQDFFNNGGSSAVIVRLFSPTDTDLKAASDAATAVSSVVDRTNPSIAQSLADAMSQQVDSQQTLAARKAAQAVAAAAQAEAIRKPSPDSVRQAATASANLLNTAAQTVASATDSSAAPTAKTTAAAMRATVDAMPDPGKTAGDIVAKAAETAAAKANATVDAVRKAANDATTALNTALQTVVNAQDTTNPPTPQSTAAAIRKAADAVADPNKAAANLVATVAEQESTNDPSPDSVRKVAQNAASAYTASLPVTRAKLTVGGLPFMAASQGSWGANLRVILDIKNISPDVANNLSVPQNQLFNISVIDTSPGGRTEQFPTVTVIDHPRRIDRVLQAGSQLLRWGNLDADGNPVPPTDKDMPQFSSSTATLSDPVTKAEQALTDALDTLRKDRNLGKDTKADQQAVTKAQQAVNDAKAALNSIQDGNAITENEFTGPGTEENKWGLYALEQVDLFNLLVIPPYRIDSPIDWNVDDALITDAVTYCEKRRAMLLVDAPSTWIDKDTAKGQFSNPPIGATDIVSTRSKNAALFFPRIKRPNVLRNNQLETYVASGMIAGIFARTDAQRGVWKAPAGLEASLVGAQELTVNLTDPENGELNPLGINCLRAFPIYGRVVWGSRTLRGADAFADDYKYVPVRRLALFIEESLYRGTQWVVFEPNDEPLWAQIRLNIGAFMHNLFRQGAFQGQTPRDAYLVKCDSETTTQNDIDLGIVNILVAFAPLKPAEFVIIQIKQLAGQIQV